MERQGAWLRRALLGFHVLQGLDILLDICNNLKQSYCEGRDPPIIAGYATDP